MTDDARRALTEEERARIHAARRAGGLCGLCGRALAEGEPIWMERLEVGDDYGRVRHWRAPVGRECALPEVLSATEGVAPEPCVVCGRGVYYQTPNSRRRLAHCSRRCAGRYQWARANEAKGS
jgi:hypothetical protein